LNGFNTKQSGHYFQIKPSVGAEEKHLHQAVDTHKGGHIFAVSTGQFVPDNHHGNARRNANQYKP
jgi:hypothetical protein